MPQIEVTFDIDANGIVNVSAKDLGTGKEQRITITASSGLAEDDIKRMVTDAAAHQDEDKKRRHAVEVHNRLDSLVYSSEKTLAEHKEKLSATELGEVESALADAKKALESEDAAVAEAAEKRLTQATHKLAEVMYRSTGATAGGGATGGPAAGTAGGTAGGTDEVIDAEVVDSDRRSN